MKVIFDVIINEMFVMWGVMEKELMDSIFWFRIYVQVLMKKVKLIGEIEIYVIDFDFDDIVFIMWIMVFLVIVVE